MIQPLPEDVIFSEDVISLYEAAELCPRRREGKRPHVSCVYRWTVNGCRGVVLESVQIGGTRCTSREALARFFQRLTELSRGNSTATAAHTSTSRQRQIDAANRELDEAGL